MILTRCSFAALLGAAWLVSPRIEAQSFDCKKATSAAERKICSDAKLSSLDEQLSSAYRNALDSPDPEQLKREQRIWLKKRDQCLNAPSCPDAVRLYNDRIGQLKTFSAQALLDFPVAESPIPKQEKARMAKAAANAHASGDVTEAQYREALKWLDSSPCDGVDRSLNDDDAGRLAPLISEQLGEKSIDLLQSFSLGKWHIFYIKEGPPGFDDMTYLFYADQPWRSQIVESWTGVATIFQTSDIAQWARSKVPGIPGKLADCFAWHVSLNRNE